LTITLSIGIFGARIPDCIANYIYLLLLRLIGGAVLAGRGGKYFKPEGNAF
jgi:hypothetical protein